MTERSPRHSKNLIILDIESILEFSACEWVINLLQIFILATIKAFRYLGDILITGITFIADEQIPTFRSKSWAMLFLVIDSLIRVNEIHFLFERYRK